MRARIMRRLFCAVALSVIAQPLFAEDTKQAPQHYPLPLLTMDEAPSPSPSPSVSQQAELSAEAQKAEDDGVKAFQKDDLEKAHKHFQRLLKLAPDNVIGLMNLGAVEVRLKLWREAEVHLKRVVRLQPEAGPAWLTLGVIYYNEDKLDAALAALSQAVLYDSKNPRAHNYLGVTIGKKGWYSGAEAELQRAVELRPDYADAHFNLALFYLQRDPPAVELARRHYMRALELGAAPDPLVEKSLDQGKK